MPGLIIAYMIGCASKLGKETKNKKKNDKSECVETNKSECKDNKSDFSVHNNTNTNVSFLVLNSTAIYIFLEK